MGDVRIKEVSDIESLSIDRVSDIAPLTIREVDNIAPVAVHLKELNRIDPLTIDSLRVSEVREIDPLRIRELNVTRLPTVNLAVRQLPEVDFNIRRVPPLTVGLSQDYCLPSSYTVRARLLGFEVLRLRLEGATHILPEERAHRAQRRTGERSWAETAAAGEPAIPSRTVELGASALPASAPCVRLSGGPGDATGPTGPKTPICGG